jgi:hypothetical protein
MRPEEAEKKYIAILRNMDGNQRAKIGAELYEMARHIVESSIRNEEPDLPEDKLKEKIRQRMSK